MIRMADAHPSAGIVVDRQGNIYFSDLDRGVLKLDSNGVLVATISKEGGGGHWLALDEEGRFSKMNFDRSAHWPRWFKRRTAEGARPALLSDGGSPIVVAPNGNLYYVCNDEKMIPGGLLIARLTPAGNETLLTPDFRETSDKLGGIKGLAFGPDNFLYTTFTNAIWKFSLDGKGSAVATSLNIPDCDPGAAGKTDGNALRGIFVESPDAIYIAATGCRRVLKIGAGNFTQTVLLAEAPWSPTGVYMRNGELFVLEYNVINDDAHDYQPRVRKVATNGQVKTLAVFPQSRH
jgi:hypothetical protein